MYTVAASGGGDGGGVGGGGDGGGGDGGGGDGGGGLGGPGLGGGGGLQAPRSIQAPLVAAWNEASFCLKASLEDAADVALNFNVPVCMTSAQKKTHVKHTSYLVTISTLLLYQDIRAYMLHSRGKKISHNAWPVACMQHKMCLMHATMPLPVAVQGMVILSWTAITMESL